MCVLTTPPERLAEQNPKRGGWLWSGMCRGVGGGYAGLLLSLQTRRRRTSTSMQRGLWLCFFVFFPPAK